MVKRTRVPLAKTAPAPAPADLEQIRAANLMERETNALDAIAQARTEATGEQQWRVYVTRVSGPQKKDTKNEARLFDCGLEDLEAIPAKLQHDFGDGMYRVRVRLDGRNFEQWDLEIELSPAERMAFNSRATMMPAAAPAPAVALAGSDSGILAQLIERQTEMFRMMMERPAAAPAAPQDPMASFSAVVTAFSQFKNLMPQQEAATGLSMFKEGMAFAEKVLEGRDGPGATNLYDLARTALESPVLKDLAQTLAAGVAQQQPPGTRPGPRLQPPPANVVPFRNTAAATHGEIEPAQIDQALDYLISEATKGTQPEMFADQALAVMPPALMAELEMADDVMALLEQKFPKIIPHHAWFDALVGAMFETAPEIPAPGAERAAADRNAAS